MLKIFRISGSSMEPTLSDGDYVVAATMLWRPPIDRMVVVKHKDYGVLVKRLQRVTSNGYILISDNPLGTDSRALGEIPERQVIGPVLFSVRRPVRSKYIPEKRS